MSNTLQTLKSNLCTLNTSVDCINPGTHLDFHLIFKLLCLLKVLFLNFYTEIVIDLLFIMGAVLVFNENHNGLGGCPLLLPLPLLVG